MKETDKQEIALKALINVMGYKVLLQIKRLVDRRVRELEQHRDTIKKIRCEQSRKGMSRKEKRDEGV